MLKKDEKVIFTVFCRYCLAGFNVRGQSFKKHSYMRCFWPGAVLVLPRIGWGREFRKIVVYAGVLSAAGEKGDPSKVL